VGKISSIQQAVVTGMNKLIESLKWGEEEMKGNQRSAAKNRVLNVLVKEKPLRNWEDININVVDLSLKHPDLIF
jgi:hypothetical protein